jgi:hypothetical protein
VTSGSARLEPENDGETWAVSDERHNSDDTTDRTPHQVKCQANEVPSPSRGSSAHRDAWAPVFTIPALSRLATKHARRALARADFSIFESTYGTELDCAPNAHRRDRTSHKCLDRKKFYPPPPGRSPRPPAPGFEDHSVCSEQFRKFSILTDSSRASQICVLTRSDLIRRVLSIELSRFYHDKNLGSLGVGCSAGSAAS